MLARRGQLSLFFMLGIVVVFIIVVLSVAFRPPDPRGGVSCDGLVDHVETVIGDSLDYCLQKVGYQGGRYEPRIAIGYAARSIEKSFDGLPTYPTLAGVAREIESCVADVTPACLRKFEAFARQGCKVSASSFEPHVVLAADDVALSVDFELAANGQEYSEFKPLNREVMVSGLHQLVVDLSEARKEQVASSDFNLDALAGFNANVTILQLPDGNQVSRLIDPESRIRDEPYEFSTANGFSRPIPDKVSVQVLLPPEMEAHVQCLNLSNTDFERDHCLLDVAERFEALEPCEDVLSDDRRARCSEIRSR